MLTEGPYAGEFLLSEASGTRSRDTITIDASQTLKAGQVLGKIGAGTQTVTVAAENANVGNGGIGVPTADAGVPAGKYKVRLFAAGATAAFTVYRPDGTVDGHGAVGTAYNGRVNFTLADGASDYAPGDGHTIEVSYASSRYVMHDPEGVDGREVAAAVLYAGVTTAAGETAKAVGVVRDAEVIAARLQWDDQDASEKAAALAALAVAGVIAR